MIRVTALNIKNISPAWFEKAMGLLPLSVKTEVMRFRKQEDRWTRVFGKALLKEQLAAFGFDPYVIAALQKGNSGKPFLPIALEFNLSHSGEWVVCAASKACIVGIDIEKISDTAPSEIREYLTPGELIALDRSQNQASCLIQIWTRKEAVLKGDGRGIGSGLGQVDTTNKPVAIGEKLWYIQDILLDRNYHCSLAADRDTAYIQQIISPDHLVSLSGK